MIEAVLQDIYFQNIYLFLCTSPTCADLCYATTVMSLDYSLDGGKVILLLGFYLFATVFDHKENFSIGATCAAS